MPRLFTQYGLVRFRASVRHQVTANRLCHGQQHNYSTEPPSKSENSQAVDLSLKDRRFVYSEHLSIQPLMLLRNALIGYLPPPLESDKDDFCHNWMHLGYQHLFFRPPLTSEMICSDGTDAKFLPGPESTWKYRLWAGGSIRYLKPFPYVCRPGPSAYLAESVSEVNVIDRDNRAEKIFVTIERQVAVHESSLAESRIQSRLVSPNQEERNLDVGLVETERICFLRDQPASLRDKRTIKPPSNPVYTHTMTPTRSLLFQFSAMTYNAHSIHLDRELARQEYGAEDLIVHGPLTMILMLEFLRITLQRSAGFDRESAGTYFVPKNIGYTNLHALYVDRPLTLCCKPSSSRSDVPGLDNTQSWQVWIQVGDGTNPSCAVKATAEVEKIRSKDVQIDQPHSKTISP